MKLATALQLGRISNLPTVWSNVLVGTLLAGGLLGDLRIPALMLALSAFYVGGMFLNDAFDRGFDAKHRPERPIPAGRASAAEVYAWGYGLMAAGALGVGLLCTAWISHQALPGQALWFVAPMGASAVLVLNDGHEAAMAALARGDGAAVRQAVERDLVVAAQYLRPACRT